MLDGTPFKVAAVLTADFGEGRGEPLQTVEASGLHKDCEKSAVGTGHLIQLLKRCLPVVLFDRKKR